MSNKILAAFQARFPDCWFKEGSEFDGGSAIVWSGEGSEIDEVAAFNYNGWEFDPHENIWQMGVHVELVKLADKFGCYWECYDPGTYFLYKI